MTKIRRNKKFEENKNRKNTLKVKEYDQKERNEESQNLEEEKGLEETCRWSEEILIKKVTKCKIKSEKEKFKSKEWMKKKNFGNGKKIWMSLRIERKFEEE